MEFFRACLDDRRVLACQDTAGNTGLAKQDHPHTVVNTETLHHVAFGGIVHASVRKAAIDVGQEQLNHFEFLILNF